jgi:hypothetical protein
MMHIHPVRRGADALGRKAGGPMKGNLSSQDLYEAPMDKVTYRSLREEQEHEIMPG